MELQKFDLIYMHRKIIKGYVIIDMLIEAPCEDCSSRKEQFQDELVAC